MRDPPEAPLRMMTYPSYIVAYIGGSGRSGSTVLDMMLGGNSHAFSGGQLDELSEWVEGHRFCTCRHVIEECPFWGSLINAGGSSMPPSLNVGGRVRKVIRTLSVMSSDADSNEAQEEEMAWRLIDRVVECTGRRIIIDSSKAALRLARLNRNERRNCLRLIHLVRDARGYVTSRSFSTVVEGPDGSVGYLSPSSKRVVVADWLVQNFVTLMLGVLFFRGRYLVIRYEALTQDPEGILGRVAAFLGTEYEPSMLPPFDPTQLHLIGGNSSRLAFTELRYDDRWRQKLSKREQIMIKVATGWLYAALARLSARQLKVASVTSEGAR
jgi:Sulfotransferase family